MTSWLMGADSDRDPEGRKHPHEAPNRFQRIQERLLRLKAFYPEGDRQRFILDRFQALRDGGMGAGEALDAAEEEWDVMERQRRESEDTGRWYKAPKDQRVW